jgi:hypothetical protein
MQFAPSEREILSISLSFGAVASRAPPCNISAPRTSPEANLFRGVKEADEIAGVTDVSPALDYDRLAEA